MAINSGFRWTGRPPLGTGLDRSDLAGGSAASAYLFNEGTGNVAYDLASSGKATLSGTTWGAQRGLVFDGTASTMTCPQTTRAVDNWTLSAWVNPATATQNDATILCNGDDSLGYSILHGGQDAASSQLFVLYGHIAWINSGIAIPANTWSHVVATRLGGTLRMYVNGVLSAQTTGTAPGVPTGGVCTVGWMTAKTRYFHGGIDLPMILNRGLTSDAVVNLYRNPYRFALAPTTRRYPAIAAPAPAGSFKPYFLANNNRRRRA